MKKTTSDDIMSEDDSHLNLDKDDDDYLESLSFKGKKEEKSHSDKSKKSGKKSLDLTGLENPIYNLFRKHSRSSRSSNSSNSFEKNNKKKYKELSSFQKLFIQSQKENFDKNYKILKEDFLLLEDYEKKIFKDTNLDLMFIMDLTGSMGVWLDEAKKSIKNIIEEITDNNPGSKIRISFIGYRDFLEINEERKYNSKEFTENIDEINNFISKLNCSGGGDVPEDIVGALNLAFNMKWESNAKYAILVCDAPCHGRKYHNVSYDRFEQGDPNGITLEDIMKKFYEKGITFYCLEIDSSTEKMFKIMKEVYNDNEKFHIEKLWNSVNQFSFFVAFSASVLLGSSKYSKFKLKDIISNCRKETIEKIMKKYIKNDIYIENHNDSTTVDLINQLENLELGKEDKKLFDFINRMNDLNLTQDKNNDITNLNNKDDINIILDIDSIKKYNEKEINYNIRALSYNKNMNTVNDWINPSIEQKEYKTNVIILYDKLNINNEKKQYELEIYDQKLAKEKKAIIPFSIKKNYYENSNEFIKSISYNELICEQIGDYFNILLSEKLPYLCQYIKFQRHILYEICPPNLNNDSNNEFFDEKFYFNNKYMISEESVQIQINASMALEKRTLQSFSHFSYQISGGQLLIGDLNYDKNLKKVIDFKIYFLKNNEYKGILEFFASHVCDNTCKVLELIHPRKKSNPIEINENFYSHKYLTETRLCECCSAPIHNNINDKNLSCKFCSSKKVFSKLKAICTECHNPFFYSTFTYNCKLTNFPNKCPKCNYDF